MNEDHEEIKKKLLSPLPVIKKKKEINKME